MFLLMLLSCVREISADILSEDVTAVISDGKVELRAVKRFHGFQINIEGFIEEKAVESHGIVTVVKTMDGKTVIATASGKKPFEKGETILTLDLGTKFLNNVLSTRSFLLPEYKNEQKEYKNKQVFDIESETPCEGVFALNTFIFSNGTTSENGTFFIGAENLHENKIQGIDILLEYDSELIQINGITPMEDEEKLVEAKRTWNATDGIIDLAMAYKREHEAAIGDATMLYRVDFSTIVQPDPFTGTIPSTPIKAEVVAEDQILFEPQFTGGIIEIGSPKLLGDFDHSGFVNVTDLATFSRAYLSETENEKYDEVFDIWPSERYYPDPWNEIYSKANPDGIIQLEDLVILAVNYYEPAPQYFVRNTKDLMKIITTVNNDVPVGEIIFINDVDATGESLIITALVDLNLNGKCLTGDLEINTNATGEMLINYGVIDGDLSITALNAIIKNFADVTGVIN